ncbi:Isoleucyl-tRNA synthetase [Desulfobulbus propionicus DSM 2032]|uniref:Isoleucine--tRNA ligase n=1 Tax=Desulfobulbus propionicus (strain ATCC 33891 / DSM 2032 / VKM B-1956 / 1pr3) TaxID=577650 RepID=A0A7U3YNC0_DESPD|nr:isoleucine--tRNA ligase [Desulfobulbus propionicus]ADW18535.1 Isoleucyl-tRNA synthetase [Desulfobulbus propionicus DSM 2032]
MDYRETLNLPQTKFKMKANLTQREPMVLKRWDKENLYQRLQQMMADRPLFILHDGPPYANGNIHLGTAFNKVLKDIILRSKRMAGFNAPYIPGWDCHGLPIEHNVDLELGAKKQAISTLGKRSACRSYAEKWIKTQREQFKRLGVLGDWSNPYLTMSFPYEAIIAREFNKFLLSGAVVRSKKPVYWCATCGTALAEAEVDYADHTSPSVYVKFPVVDDLGEVAPQLAGRSVSVLIWTTTPWTLPANLAIAFHPDFEYAAVAVGDETWILAKELVAPCMEQFGIDQYASIATFSASSLENKRCRHPFMERDALLVLADYVTADSGTGCVHTAPGHGTDDYLTGLRYGLDILSPVDDAGRYTAEAGRYAGQPVPQVNSQIIADMAAAGSLVKEASIRHSYPHCWRCKEPVIYRATAQWFISMDNLQLRAKALSAINEVQWTPAWGQQRIYGMVEARPDWCLSRQRSWGVPVTVLTCAACGEILKNETVCARIDELFMSEGADAWFKHEAADFVPEGVACSCGGREFKKESDILDVWFDSGVSHAAVVEQRPELRWPADLYLEGSDQHRGWFQSSLLTSVGTRGRAPYQGVLTHGYVVDGQGKKMSKSVGNVVAPQQVIDQYGAEVLRLWVASENYQDDVKVSDEILKHVSDAYRKMRNTLRFLLSNLYDFAPERDAVDVSDLQEIDRWALAKYAELSERVTRAYDRYEFHAIYHALHNFCGTTISSIYMDVLKDRLYCSAPAGPERRAAQTVIYRILDGLLRLMSPILCFTAAEAWEHLHGLSDNTPLEQSIFFTRFAPVDDIGKDTAFEERWTKLLTLRGAITRVLEGARRDKVIGLGLDAEVVLRGNTEWAGFLNGSLDQLRELCIVSSLRSAQPGEGGFAFVEAEGIPGLEIAVHPAPGAKCERCWTIATSVGEDHEHPSLCARCAAVVRQLAG